MLGIRISRSDARAVRSAMAELRAEGLITGRAREVREEMYLALWHYIGGPLQHDVAVAAAYLAALCYLREQRHLAPTAPVEPEPPPTKPRASWWGSLFSELDED